ncbi:MAG: hypothetical protein R6V04_14040 [bacterium]
MYTEFFLREKLEYIHANPTQEQWVIVDTQEIYPFSSAGIISVVMIIDRRGA